MKKCVIYARYSSANQREVSAEEQVRFCQEFIKANGNICVGSYIDKEQTGTNDRRAQFQQMITDSKTKKFDCVVVYKNDRFARNIYDKAHYKRILLLNGVVINYVKEEMLNEDSPESALIESVLDGMAEYYSKNLSREVMEKGLLPNAKKAKHNGGTPPLGLDVLADGHYTVNEAEAGIVRMIFNWYAEENLGYREITYRLNELGLKNKRGEPFVGNSIRDILLNEKYIGVYIYNRRAAKQVDGRRNNSEQKPDDKIVRLPDSIPAIVDHETFNKVKDIMTRRKGRNAAGQAKETYLLSGLIRCGNCGCLMHGNRKTSHGGKSKHVTYKCNNRDKAGTRVCDAKEINKEYLEAAILHYISQMCEGKNVKRILSALHQYADEQNGDNQDEWILKREITRADKEISNIMKAIRNGFDAEELQAEYQQLKVGKTKQELKLSNLQARNAEKFVVDDAQVLAALKTLRSDLESENAKEDYKNLFQSFVESVDVFEGYVTIALSVVFLLGLRSRAKISRYNNRPLPFQVVVCDAV